MVEPNLVWKDTVLVRTGQTVDVLLDITNPGVWMAHCHIEAIDSASSGVNTELTIAAYRVLVVADCDTLVRPVLALEIELAAGNAGGTARAIARAYSAFAESGAEMGITPETFARVTAAPSVTRPRDVALGVPSYVALGFLRPGPDVSFGSSPRAFGAPGAGGSFAFADPDAHIGYAYVMNKLDFHLQDDPREKALRDAVYHAVARLADRSGGGERRASREIAAV